MRRKDYAASFVAAVCVTSTGTSCAVQSKIDENFLPYLQSELTRIPPDPPENLGVDSDATHHAAATAHWAPAVGPAASRLDHYEIAVGTSPGESDVTPWTNIGRVSAYQLTESNEGTQASFYAGDSFFTSVRAVGKNGLTSAASTSSPWTMTNWEFHPWASDSDLAPYLIPSLAAEYTHRISVAEGNDLTIAGLVFNRSSGEGSYSCDGPGYITNSLGGNGSLGSESDKLERSFRYGRDPNSVVLSGLDPQAQYEFTWFQGDWSGGGGIVVTIESSLTGQLSPAYWRDTHQIITYRYRGVSAITFTFRTGDLGNTPHLFAFTNRRMIR